MDLLRARLNQRSKDEQENRKREDYATKDANTWSNQIRSYILHPYSMVKDHLFGVTDNDVQSVLNGELRGFLEEMMRRTMYSDYGLAKFDKE